MTLDKWVVFFLSSEGYREGAEVITAGSKEEAIEMYKRFFNVQGKVHAIRRLGAK